ncbi:MAG: lysophospholipid acyltransferase family protein [Luteolibacter sp.]
MEAPFFKKLTWRIEAAAHTAIAAVLKQLPPETVFITGEFIGKLIWPFMTQRQNTIMRNLRIVTAPETDLANIRTLARESFIRTFANLVCSSVLSKASGKTIREILTVENPELLEDAFAKGNGVVLALGHMGNWELLTRLHHFFPEGAKAGAFYRPLNNLILNERILKEREADGTRLFSKRDSLHHVTGFLRDNGVIGILADQRVGFQGELLPFFGRITRASPLPGLLVRRCKSEVLALSMHTTAPGKWSARYHPVEQPYQSTNISLALEKALKVNIMDVFWLQERWKIYIGKRVTPKKWFKTPDIQGQKPHRALIWIEPGQENLPLNETSIHQDIVYEKAINRSIADLASIDLQQPLPLDFILIFTENPRLRSAAKSLGIPVFLTSEV